MALTLDQILATIRTVGALLDDLEEVRIANGNRVAKLTKQGMSFDHFTDPGVGFMSRLENVEELAVWELIQAWRRHPLRPWAKDYIGVGEKSIARLIAVIGDPYMRGVGHWVKTKDSRDWVIDYYEPRTVSELWAYCGHGDPERKKRKGMTQDELFKMGNPRAKKQVWLIADALRKRQCPACQEERDRCDPKKNGGVLDNVRDWTPAGCSCLDLGYDKRHFYNQKRASVAEKTHSKECIRCGPSGHPAPPGTPWSAAHQHAHALRVTGKEFLKDLWLAAQDLAA